MKILIDMNLSPQWADTLSKHGHKCVHWSEIGEPTDPDTQILEWASNNNYVVLTHDLDFGAILAITRAKAPSVIQLRTVDILPPNLEKILVKAFNEFSSILEAGALIVIDESGTRAKILPINR